MQLLFIYLFAVNNYESLISDIDRLGAAIPQAKPFIAKIDADIKTGEAAAKSGNKAAMQKALAAGIKDAEAVAPAVKSNPRIYRLAKMAPAIVRKMSAKIQQGAKGVTNVNGLAGKFHKKLNA